MDNKSLADTYLRDRVKEGGKTLDGVKCNMVTSPSIITAFLPRLQRVLGRKPTTERSTSRYTTGQLGGQGPEGYRRAVLVITIMR